MCKWGYCYPHFYYVELLLELLELLEELELLELEELEDEDEDPEGKCHPD